MNVQGGGDDESPGENEGEVTHRSRSLAGGIGQWLYSLTPDEKFISAGLVIFSFSLIVGIVGMGNGWWWSAERRKQECRENLAKIDGAKEQWSLENNQHPSAIPVGADLGPEKYLKQMPVCPSGFTYRINAVSESPECPSGLPGHEYVKVIPVCDDCDEFR